jgi:penicillin-binding protein 1B
MSPLLEQKDTDSIQESMTEPKKDPSRASWKRIVVYGLISLALAGLGLFTYCWYLSTQIENRFSGQRWQIPSKVYSDITILYPGQNLPMSRLLEKFRRLGYHEVSGKPTERGELRTLGSVIDIFLHDLDVPSRKVLGFPAQIRFAQGRIASIVHSETGEPVSLLELEPEEIMLFFGPERERRQLVSIDQTPPHLIHAVLSAEDSRFFQHHGFDLKGILRAFLVNLRHGAIRQGGSTITQQLAKSYFLTPERTMSRKLKELLMSFTIEVMYDKDEILEIYLNEIYLGQKGTASINGVGEASYFYFGKPIGELSLLEAAMIAGLIKAPNRYSPYVNKEESWHRRNVVLRAMHNNGYISAEELEASLPLPIETVGFTYYGKQAPYFIDFLSKQLNTLYPAEALASIGLSIYTTLDPEVQAAAERALDRGLVRLEESNPSLNRLEQENRIQGAIVVMQPKTGHILAMVGGRDYVVSQFNRITQARRQPGSAFKPIVFLSGLDAFTPASMLSNEPAVYEIDGKLWRPENFEPGSGGQVSMRYALAHSLNLATVDLAMRVGLDRVTATASRFGFSTPIKEYPSLALGSLEVIPLELARAFCVFAADGMLPHALSLKEIVDKDGRIVERRHMSIEQVTSPAKSYIITSMLSSAVTDGTARSLKDLGVSFQVAGKTGTTNNFRDAWFVGYTPDILALVWVGFDNGDSIHAPASSAALPIWVDLMRSIPEHISGEWFREPKGIVRKVVCAETGDLAVRGGCPQPVEEVFLVENAPEKRCSLHKRKGLLRQILKGVKDLFKNPNP